MKGNSLLKVAAWLFLSLSILNIAQVWTYILGAKLLLESFPGAVTGAVTFVDALVLIAAGAGVFLAIPLLMPSGFRNWYLAGGLVIVNLLTIRSWVGWWRPLGDENFMFSVVLMTIAMVMNAAVYAKHIWEAQPYPNQKE